MATPIRLIIFALVLSTAIVEYVSRLNLNVAMVSMVNPINKTSSKLHEVCPIPMEKLNGSSSKTALSKGQKFDWSSKVQGVILGAFYYSHVPMQIPIGRMAEIFGGRRIIVFGLAGSSLVNLATPLIASSTVLMVMSRIFLGFFQCGMMLSCYQILCKWLPIKERSSGIAFLEVACNLGVIISSSLTGYLSEHGFAGGWPSAFYVPGALAIAMFAVNYMMLTSTPQENKLISDKELDKICGNEGNPTEENETKKKLPFPWKDVLTSVPVIVAILSRYSLYWTCAILTSKLPAYMSDILHVSPSRIGYYGSLIFVAMDFTLLASGYLSEFIISRKWLSRTNTRKLFILISRIGMAFTLFLIPSSQCNELYVITLLMVSMLFYGLCSGGDLPVPAELSAHFPASILALISAVCATSGFVVPYIVGVILDSYEDIFAAWSLIFYMSAGMSIFCGLIFALFGSAERQKWDYVDDQNRNVVVEVVQLT